jgi:hypothetical protein
MITEEQEVWKSRYEKLRQQALEPSETLAQDRWGLGLLIRKGVAGWMQAWRDPSGSFDVAAADQVTSVIVPRCSWQQEATLLLANMALSHCHLEPSPSV